MTSVRPRENTFKVDLSVFPKRPSFEEIHSFVHDVMGLRIDQVKRLQMNHVQNAAHVKCDTLKTAQDAVEEHDGRHEIELNKVKYKVRLQMDDSTVEVKVHDLSENVRDEELIGFLRHYGDVHCIKELVWGKLCVQGHLFRHSRVQQEKTLVTYRGQPQTCRHCSRLSHPGITCTDNKKLVGQKSDLSDRLKAAQSTDSTSYATVVDKGTAIINSLLPNFVATNLNQLNQAASESKQKELDTTAQQPSCSHLSTATDGVEQSSSSTITPAVAEDDSMSDETIVPVANETELMDQDLQQPRISHPAPRRRNGARSAFRRTPPPLVQDLPRIVQRVDSRILSTNATSLVSFLSLSVSGLHCQQRHHSLLHVGHADNSPRTNSGATAPTQASGQLEVSASVVSTKQEVATPTEVVPQVEVSVPLQQPKENVFLLTVLIKVVDSLGMEHVARALLDSASQPNLITDRMARILRLKRAPASVVIQGAGQMSTPVRHSASTEVRSRKSDFSCGINFLVMDKLTAELPSHNISTSGWNIPVELFLADPTFNERQPIDMVLGAKHFHSFFPSAARIHLDGSLPILVDSVFGWIVTGSASQASSTPTETAHSYSVLAMMSLEESMERFWKTEELTINDKLSVEERDCESLFQSTTTRTPEGRYVLERRLERDAQLKADYHKFMREDVELGHMQLVEPDEKDKTPSCYLPHHPVFKDSSTTTKVRVVFDGSAATSTGFSLNQALCVGPVVQEDLLSLLLRFRNYPVALVADAAKMYRQVLVHPEDRRLQRIFWRFSPDSPIQTYELQTVTYGLAPSAYLATRSLQQLAQDEGHEYALGGPALESNFYVDDFIGGADTVEDAIRLRKELTELLAKGGFEMRKWTSNRLEVLRGLTQDQIGTQSSLQFGPNEMVKALGIGWEPEADVLRFDSQINQSKGPPTKQFILSTIARLYDPLGHIAPVVVTAKIIMQECWQLKCDWNDPVPDNIRIKWEKFFKELPKIRSYKIDRYALQPDSTYQLHTFCDASKDAYGACCYIRCEDRHGNVRVTFLASKSRIAPLRGLNVPRLEANAAVLGVHLHFRIKQALKIKISDSYFWTDSAVVLQWIQANPNTWKTYVANRVAEIQFYTRGCHWNHVPTKDNPADLVSRGMTVPNFLNCETWKNATSWICSNPRDWPRTNPQSVPSDILEVRVVAAVTEKPPQVHPWFLRCHSYRRLVHSIGFVLRFIDNTRQKARTTRTTPVPRALTVEQFAKAKMVLTRLAQQDSFSAELTELEKGKPVPKQSNIYKMSPFVDSERVLRVGGRLKLSQLPFQAKHPALLPGSHPFARILAEFYHQKLFHGGGRLLLTAMREEFWPIGGRILARSVVRNCFRCVRLNPELVQQQIGQLPAQRIIPSRPFSVVGVDYAGPLYLKPIHKRAAPAKAYICLFVCFATKAVHIELVGDLSTPAFLAALRRFIGRRGVPSHIHSDNGKNFEGAKNELARLYAMLTHDDEQEKIHEFSPHFGGLWESAVKVAKKHLFRQLGPSRLSFEDMCTVLTQIESHMNSRPLLPLSEDPNDLAALTPAHFLIGTSMHALPDPDLRHIPVNRLNHYQQLQLHAQQFWAHWRREYLQELLRDTKGYQRNDEIQPGRLVIVVDELQGPLRWPLARIEAVHPGPYGIVRVVSLRTASGGIITRPAVKICLLPVPLSPEAPHITPQPGQLPTDEVFPEEEKH
ncbi:uncharacterized protein LOC119769172 [Culex quinquefasciatus]|uniref:uncharacterized protein LOC119769172 n=1 Tax=Culex quinquefasciatus TaxID=7176 RepID=UPI0018E38849|nr:uncharacterized protein LOC119769172 [Culex quinquefasciatus]